MTQWIDIVDTVVKIGLGAAISGIATYKVTSLKQKSDNEQSKKEVIRDLLLEAVKYSDQYIDYIYSYYSILDGIAEDFRGRELNDEIWVVIYKRVKEKDDAIGEIWPVINAAQSRFQLLGFVEPLELLREFRLSESEIRDFLKRRDKVMPDEEFFLSWCNRYVPLKNKFQESVSKIFLEHC